MAGAEARLREQEAGVRAHVSWPGEQHEQAGAGGAGILRGVPGGGVSLPLPQLHDGSAQTAAGSHR